MIFYALLLSSFAVRVLDALPTPEISSSVEKFYDEKLERHVERIAEQIVAYNVHHQPHQHAHQHHHHGHAHGGKHEKHTHDEPQQVDFDDEDTMQSDQPMPGAPLHTIATHPDPKMRRAQGQQTIEDRDKIAMENSIKERVIMFVTKGNGSNSYGERDRSFYANCDQPKSAEDNDDLMKLYFTLSQLEDNIAVANLRLYRKHIANHSAISIDTNGEPIPCNLMNRGDNQEGEKLYRVTVYYQVKGAKKHKSKRKIGDSLVISDSTAFVNLNVLHGIRELNKGKLFSVIIQIEDQFGGTVKANDFFKGPTCTVGMQVAQALPTVFEEAHAANLGRIPHTADYGRKPVQPKLDIKTIQEPEGSTQSGHLYDASPILQNRHVLIRHASHHRPRMTPPAAMEGSVIVSKAGAYNINDLKLIMQRIEESKAQSDAASSFTT